jgi:hypothetical protein
LRYFVLKCSKDTLFYNENKVKLVNAPENVNGNSILDFISKENPAGLISNSN